MMQNKKGLLLIAIRLTLTIVLLFAILHLVDRDALVASLFVADKGKVLLALYITLLHVFFKSYKWYLLASQLHQENSFGDAVKSYLRGTSLAIVTPSRIGELGRVVGMKGQKLHLGSLTLIDKLSELWIVACFVLLGGQSILTGYKSIVSAAILAFILLFLYQFRALYGLIIRHVPFVFIRSILHGFTIVSWPLSNIVLLLSFLTMCVYFLQAYLLLSAYAPVAISTILMAFPLLLLTNLIPLTIGSLGVREGVAIYLLSQFGISAEVAVSVSLLLFIFDTVIPGIAGSLLFSLLLKRR